MAGYVSDRWRVRVAPQTGWRWLVAFGFTLQVSRPAHTRGGRGGRPPVVKYLRQRRAKVLVLLMDNAGWHVAERLVVPPNVLLHFLPTCASELPPAEPIGLLVRQAVSTRSIGRIDRLRAILRSRPGSPGPEPSRPCNR